MPYPLELFEDIPPGRYTVGYLVDGWTKEVTVEGNSPTEILMKTQNALGSICGVTYVEEA